MNAMRVAVTTSSPLLTERAENLARALGLPLVPLEDPDADLLLVWTRERLELREVGASTGSVYVDFVGGKAAHRRRFGGGRKQPLARAVGLKGQNAPHVLDATAGLGRDAFVLATLGCTVHLVERSPIIGALLEDGLRRAGPESEVSYIVARMSLSVGQAAHVMRALTDAERPDVVYLDPMYPHGKGSALQKKEMRLFRDLVGDDADAHTLLNSALTCAKKRVVVKRPRSAPVLGERTPSAEVRSKNTRYDLYW